jgi:hypothetical protein
MNCIFCKKSSIISKSVEHIIPESLGNKEHILPKGIVCDRCNNYFSNKIEKPLLELPYFVSLRHRKMIESKRGRIPVDEGFLLAGEDGYKVNFHINEDGKSLSFDDENAVKYLLNNKQFTVIALVNDKPPADSLYISKLLGKVAMEAFAKIGLNVEGGIKDIIDNPGLDPLRNYVRFGTGPKFWPYHVRPIYPETHYFIDEANHSYEVLHEFQLFQTTEHQWHLVLVIFGFEYCIDLTGPDMDSYLLWLKNNNNESPLYYKLK